MSGAYGPQRSSVLVRIAGLVFGLLATGLQLAAQSAPGSLQGVVTDPSGARIPKAALLLPGVASTKISISTSLVELQAKPADHEL
jgi:hypothetical protein